MPTPLHPDHPPAFKRLALCFTKHLESDTDQRVRGHHYRLTSKFTNNLNSPLANRGQ